MGLKKQIQEDKLLARKGGFKDRVSVLTVLLGEIDLSKNIEIIAGEKVVSDDSIIGIIKKMVENNKLTHNESENTILEYYLPRVLTEEETEFMVKDVITDLGVKTMKDMGLVMGEMKKQHGASIDGKLTSNIVKKLLS